MSIVALSGVIIAGSSIAQKGNKTDQILKLRLLDVNPLPNDPEDPECLRSELLQHDAVDRRSHQLLKRLECHDNRSNVNFTNDMCPKSQGLHFSCMGGWGVGRGICACCGSSISISHLRAVPKA